MKKLSLLLVLCVSVMALCACSDMSKGNENIKSATQAVADAIEVVKNYDVEKMSTYFSDDKAEFEGMTPIYNEFMKLVYGKLEYSEPKGESMDESTIQVKVNVKSVDMADIIGRSVEYLRDHPEDMMLIPE